MNSEFDFQLPEHLIATSGAKPRHSARLLVYNTLTDKIVLTTVFNLAGFLNANDVIVFNDTKVLPARLKLYKETGGIVELLFLVHETAGDINRHSEMRAMVDRRVLVGDKLFLGPPSNTFKNEIYFEAIGQEEHIFRFKVMPEGTDIFSLLLKFGSTPIPKYIHNSPLPETKLRERYQSIFARKPASSAAPTASLHFTERLLGRLKYKGVKSAFVTLHVGLGTFAPLTEEAFRTNQLHSEHYEIPALTLQTIKQTKDLGHSIIAVGTTTTRALESGVQKGETTLFIKEPFQFKVIDHLFTNFHLPKSSLLCLVDAFLRHKKAKKSWRDLYEYAIQNNMRFYSFGDAMLIL